MLCQATRAAAPYLCVFVDARSLSSFTSALSLFVLPLEATVAARSSASREHLLDCAIVTRPPHAIGHSTAAPPCSLLPRAGPGRRCTPTAALDHSSQRPAPPPSALGAVVARPDIESCVLHTKPRRGRYSTGVRRSRRAASIVNCVVPRRAPASPCRMRPRHLGLQSVPVPALRWACCPSARPLVHAGAATLHAMSAGRTFSTPCALSLGRRKVRRVINPRKYFIQGSLHKILDSGE